MLSLLRNRFGIPGAISVIALVFAMFGGAYAASNNGSGKATASAKAKKGPRGPKGAKGDTGPAGPAGPAGAQGPAGANGKDGSNGSNGANGANGKSVSVTELGPGECNNGEAGALFTVGGEEAEACNGEEGLEGPEGPEGKPWTAGGMLPSGKTETGAFSQFVKGEAYAPISFTVPLAQALPEAKVHLASEDATDCPGTAAEPKAAKGHLCVYVAANEGAAIVSKPHDVSTTIAEQEIGAAKAGAFLILSAAEAVVWGTWAVTAP